MILGRFHHPWYGRAMPLSAHAINTTVKYPWCFCLLLALVGGRCCCVMKLKPQGGPIRSFWRPWSDHSRPSICLFPFILMVMV